MAQFKFPLDPLLRQRERVEQERQRELAVVNADLVAAQAALAEAEQKVATALADLRENRLIGRIDLAFLTAHRRFMLGMQRQGAERAQRVAAATVKVDVARRNLAEAAKGRRAIETLRDQQHERWRADQAGRETAATDEVAMQMAVADLRDEDGR